MSLSPQTLIIGTSQPVPLFPNNANGIGLIINVGGLDLLRSLPGPADVLLGTQFALTSITSSSALLNPATLVLLAGASLALPTTDQIYALALGAQTALSILYSIKDA